MRNLFPLLAGMCYVLLFSTAFTHSSYYNCKSVFKQETRNELASGFNLNISQIDKVAIIVVEYKNEIERLNNTVMPNKERTHRRKNAKKSRNATISTIVSVNILSDLLRYLDLADEKEFIENHFPIYSYETISKIAPLHLDHVTAKREVLMSEKPYDTKKKEIRDLNKQFKSALKAMLTPTEYDAWVECLSIYLDQRLIRYYQLTDAQLISYRDIMNEHAVAGLVVKRMRLDESQKAEKNDSIFNETYGKLKNILSSQQLGAWHSDNINN